VEEECSREAVETAERHADGLVKDKELRAAYRAASRLAGAPARACAAACAGDAAHAALYAARDATEAVAVLAPDAPGAIRPVQADILRDLFNPFRPLTVEPRWRSAEVLALAREVFDLYNGLTPLSEQPATRLSWSSGQRAKA